MNPAAPLARRSWSRWIVVGVCACAALSVRAAEEAPRTAREAVRSMVRTEHRYDPTIRQKALAQAAQDPDVIQLQRVVVTENKVLSLLEQWYQAKQRAMEAAKPSVTTGAAVDRTLGGRPVRVGAQPYRDLLADDARFKADRAITPTWTLLDMKL